ncbi:hypothetical protein M422DRAFT_273456 [Sphaerobolus stellatus SS14]|uniref:Uncharacterized protein n=1 Tax=Sphaerobolus stellatus (strain SS14) TaxID=990650 RepID=A0A0C9U959_SPHS4|nr:hypothetical protein M422DRAFT_273456 [Sphaerobolus stellatus SS14]
MVDILASATVLARVVLPKGIDIEVSVKRLWVDCLVYDGPISNDEPVEFNPGRRSSFDDDSEPPLPEPMPLPNPIPARAFGRITPRTWLNATSASLPVENDGPESSGDGRSVYVRADVVDVPLEVLPGRQNELRRFVTKVLFSKEPVKAGIQGVAAVGITVPGLTGTSRQPRVEGGELILTGLPFEGDVNVGGRSTGV